MEMGNWEFTQKKIKIAIILAGQLRHWDITSKIFQMYNDIHPDVQYDFFLSTWDDSYANTKVIESNFSFLNAYEVIGTSIIGNHDEDYVKYPYLLKKVNQLKNDYQNEYDIKYDCVISTRPDIFLSLEMLHRVNIIINNTTSDQITPNTIYSQNGITEKLTTKPKSYINEPHFYMNDWCVFGHENAINIHANIYDDMYVKKIQPNVGVHITPAEHIINNKLNCRPVTYFISIIRYSHVDYFINLHKTGKLKNMYNIKHGTLLSDKFKSDMHKLSNNYDKHRYGQYIKPKNEQQFL
jgi:hypothetical protein